MCVSIIDQLIQIKKSADSNDIVNMLDEFTVYSRLSKIPALSDISKSSALKKQLPLLSKAIEGDIYCLSLYMVAANIIGYLGYDIPETIATHIDNTPDSLKQKLIIAQENTIRVDYQSLDMYQHDSMRDTITAIYIHKPADETRIVILTRSGKQQRIFQGSYIESEETSDQNSPSNVYQKARSLRYEDDHLRIKIDNYSIQGNNAYFFAEVKINHVGYRMMLDNQYRLVFKANHSTSNDFTIELDISAMNRINMAKSEPKEFIATLAQIINESGVIE